MAKQKKSTPEFKLWRIDLKLSIIKDHVTEIQKLLKQIEKPLLRAAKAGS
jgi:hypothetical protein